MAKSKIDRDIRKTKRGGGGGGGDGGGRHDKHYMPPLRFASRGHNKVLRPRSFLGPHFL